LAKTHFGIMRSILVSSICNVKLTVACMQYKRSGATLWRTRSRMGEAKLMATGVCDT